MQRAFVIRPFGKKADASGTAIDFEQVHEQLIAPALKDAGLGGGTTGEIIDAGNVREDMHGQWTSLVVGSHSLESSDEAFTTHFG